MHDETSPLGTLSSLRNGILRELPPDQQAALLACSTHVQLNSNEVLRKAGQAIEHVYFIESGVVSLRPVARDDRSVQTGLIGSEGVVGGEIVFDARRAHTDAVVLLAGEGLRVSTAAILKLLGKSSTLARLISQHLNFVLFQAQQTALCHALHPIEAQLSTWVLKAGALLGTTNLGVTQETIAHTLGIQRTSVSMTAHALQLRNLLRTRRGQVEILDAAQLGATACECHSAFAAQLEVLSAAYQSTSSAESSALRHPTLLIVEDDETLAYALRRYFEGKGYRVISTPSPTKALEAIRNTPPDFVVTDLRFPTEQSDGLKLATIIRAERPTTPVIFITAYPEMLSKHRPQDGSDVFFKPIDLPTLHRALENRLLRATAQ